MGCYGDTSIKTAAIDSLCRDGLRFANAFTASSITNTAHASILSGLYPSETGVLDFGSPLRPGIVTLAQALKQSGYQTAGFIAAVILDSKTLAPGLDRGFDFYDNFPARIANSTSRYKKVERRGMDVVHRAENWIRTHGSSQPKFVWVHLYDPHDPYDPPPPFRKEYKQSPYDGEIAYADSALGEFLRFLKANGKYDSALIVLSGDHGEGLGEHGEDTHGLFLYDTTTHIPLIVKPPRSTKSPLAGKTLQQEVRTVDIMPTVLDVAGVPAVKNDGASMRPLWTDSNKAAANEQSRNAIAETDYPLRFGWSPLKSVRSPEQKYIEAPRPEFYDLAKDPKERHNIYEPWNADVQGLRATLAQYRERVKEKGSSVGAVSAQQVEELKAIGYWGNERGSTTAPEPSMLPDPKDKIPVQNALHIAMLAEEDGRTAQAESAYEQALKLDPESPVALSQLGELELKQRDYKRAAELLAQAGQLRPDSATALHEGQARYELGEYENARKALEASLALSSGQYDARYLLGKTYANLKQWSKAEDQFEAAVFLDGKSPEARTELARVLLEERQPKQALEQLRSASKLGGAQPEIQKLTAQAQQQLGNSE